MKITIELGEDDEILEREIKKFGSSAHIIIPKEHLGKKAKIICIEDDKQNIS